MILLTKDLQLYDTKTYGMDSWGSSSQVNIDRKRKNWYIHSWVAGNEWVEDYNEDIKLDVIKEFKNIEEVKKYIDALQESLKDIEEQEKILNEWDGCNKEE